LWVHFILDILDNEALPFLHTVFQEHILELWVVEGCDASIRLDLIGVLLPDPEIALSLRVDQERVTSGVGNHDTILD
jgi:hypothetical protein